MPDQSSGPGPAAVIRLVDSGDKDRLLALMEQSRFTISGISARSVYAALCSDALGGSRVIAGVAEMQSALVGFLLVIVDWQHYWKSFLLRHPVLAVRIMSHRLRRQRRSHEGWSNLPKEDQEYISSVVSAQPSGRSWADSSPAIAKVVFIHVAPSARGQGIGAQLYRHGMQVLAERGIARFDAKVDLSNRRSIPLHVDVGFRLERSGGTLFATKDLTS